jgi:hypothetical protein
MQPIKTALFVFLVLFLLLVLTYFAPFLTHYFGLHSLSYPEIHLLSDVEESDIEEKEQEYDDIIMAKMDSLFFPLADTFFLVDKKQDSSYFQKDTLQQRKDPVRKVEKKERKEPKPVHPAEVQKVSAKELLNRGRHIEYSENDKTILYSFFSNLSRLSQTGELIRILHYGDSQIEGDRITSYLRNRFQKDFGGSGIGLFPVTEMRDHNISIQLATSSNWRQYFIRDRVDIPEGHKQYGILTGFARYNDFSAHRDNANATFEAWIRVKKQSFSYPLSRTFKTFRVFYGFNQAPLITQMISNNISLDADIIEPSFGLQVLEWEFEETPNEFELHFQGEDSPDIFAISLDGDRGVAVDNIPLRGSSGLEFTRTNRQFYGTMYNQLNVKMVLLQFGVNVAPHVVDNYGFYENRLYNQLRYLNKLHPGLAIVVMGISDISQKKGTGYASYPNVELIRDAQRNAAYRAGCAFWDVYEAMGGENSMVEWVFSDPPLAARDFIHFNHKGAVVIGEMFYNALMEDYHEYLNRK